MGRVGEILGWGGGPNVVNIFNGDINPFLFYCKLKKIFRVSRVPTPCVHLSRKTLFHLKVFKEFGNLH